MGCSSLGTGFLEGSKSRLSLPSPHQKFTLRTPQQATSEPHAASLKHCPSKPRPLTPCVPISQPSITAPSVASFGGGGSGVGATTNALTNARAPGAGRKRNTSIAGLDSSPGSIEDVDGDEGSEDRKRHPVKRACNECRQQKVSESFRATFGKSEEQRTD
jgi:hypothetical protein